MEGSGVPSSPALSPQACLMHEAKNFSTYFPVIFCLESGSSVTKNLEAVCAPPRPSLPLLGVSLSP